MWESRRGDECLRQAVFSANGIRTHNDPGLNRMPLPVGLPRCIEYRFRAVVCLASTPGRIRTGDLHRDKVASTPGCSARAC